MIDIIERFFIQCWLSFKALFSWMDPKAYITIKVLNPIFQLLFFCLLAKYCYNTDDLTSWVISNSLLLCIYNTIFGVGSVFTTERYFGTLKMIIVSPANKFLSFLERGLIHMLDGLLTVIIGLIAGSILFNVNLNNINFILFILLLFIAMFSSIGFGLFIGSLGLITTELNLIMNVVSMLIITLSGANFPVDLLPIFLQKLALFLPLTRSIQGVNMLISNSNFEQLLILLRNEFFLGIAYIILGYILIIITEKISQKKASLEIF